MCFLFMGRQIGFVLDMVSYVDADEVGLDVVGGESECGKEVVVEVVACGHFLVKQHPEGRRVERNVVAQADIKHEADAVEQHLISEQESWLQVDVPVGLGDFVGVVVDQFDSKSQPIALGDLEHEVGSQIVHEKIFVGSVLLTQVLESYGVLIIGDKVPFPIKLEEIVLGSQPLVDVGLGWRQVP